MSKAGKDKKSGKQPADGSPGYSVGYGKPPVEHQFPPRTSGNPGGRPPGPRRPASAGNPKISLGMTLADEFWLKEACTSIKATINGKARKMTAHEAVLMSIRQKALAGGIMAMRLYNAMVSRAQDAARQVKREQFEGIVEYKLEAEARIKRRKAAGLPYDDILPHPDDVLLDPRTGDADIVGPLDEAERAAFADHLELLVHAQQLVSDMAASYSGARKEKQAQFLERWHLHQRSFDQLNDLLPPSLQMTLRDRSTASGASKAGDFFQYSLENIASLKQTRAKRRG